MSEKPKLAMYWASSCGGCEIALLNIHEMILDVDAAFDFMFCPCLLDTKKKDIEALEDGEIALTFFNGAIRTTENEEMAHLLRRKSEVLVAFGSCAHEGCIPGLANLHKPEDFFKNIYIDNPSVDNPDGIYPLPTCDVPEGTLTLPEFYDRVMTLSQTTDVDYFFPGCPPEPHQIRSVLSLILSGGDLPPKGSVIGAGRAIVCDECAREKSDKKISRFYRTYEKEVEPDTCLLEQGIICMGVATRSGCDAPCLDANMPCTGCYGAPEGALDQGARMVAALGSIIDIDPKGLSEETLSAKIKEMLKHIPDYAGTFYKYSLPASILKGSRK
jgi:F420-non-reducing hydrogenase small subunit